MCIVRYDLLGEGPAIDLGLRFRSKHFRCRGASVYSDNLELLRHSEVEDLQRSRTGLARS